MTLRDREVLRALRAAVKENLSRIGDDARHPQYWPNAWHVVDADARNREYFLQRPLTPDERQQILSNIYKPLARLVKQGHAKRLYWSPARWYPTSFEEDADADPA